MEQNPLVRLIQAATLYADRTDDLNVYVLESDLRAAAMGMKSKMGSERGPAHPYDMGPGQNQDGSPKVTIPECDCGNTADPNHPKRGKCKASLGGVKL